MHYLTVLSLNTQRYVQTLERNGNKLDDTLEIATDAMKVLYSIQLGSRGQS